VVVLLYFQCDFAAARIAPFLINGRHCLVTDFPAAKFGYDIKIMDAAQRPGRDRREATKAGRDTTGILILKRQKNNRGRVRLQSGIYDI
jgi:hypothetical protein